MVNWLLKISSRLFSSAVLAAIAIGFIYFASTRSLPFLAKEEQEYSIIEETTSEENNMSGDNSGGVSGESSGETGVSVEEDIDIPSYLTRFGTAVPSGLEKTVSDEKYNPINQKLLLYDLSSLDYFDGVSVTVRMGFVFAGDRIYTSGLVDVTNVLKGYTFAGERDLNGNPLFMLNGSYYYLDSSLVLQKSNYKPLTDKRGFDFDVPVYLGVQDANIQRMYDKSYPEGQRYGYYGNDRVYANYCREVFAFSNGRGCAIKNEYGVDKLEIFADFFYAIDKSNLVTMAYYPPESRGLSSIGYFYFDDNFTRVRVKNEDGTYSEGLSDGDGNLLNLVNGYTLYGYSDSVLLVGNGTAYGYMTNNLNWITDPVFTDARPFLEGLAVVQTSNGKYGVIDTEGNYVIKPAFDSITNCSGGVIAAYSETNGWSLFVKVYS